MDHTLYSINYGKHYSLIYAAISPAEVSFGETLSTLRYASRAKNIVNKPVVNEVRAYSVLMKRGLPYIHSLPTSVIEECLPRVHTRLPDSTVHCHILNV